MIPSSYFKEIPRNPTMPKNRIIPSLSLALVFASWARAQDTAIPAAAPAPGQVVPETVAPPTAAEKQIDEAIKKVKAVPSVSAKLVIVADMLNQKFSLEGEFKKAPDNKLLVFLKLVGLGDATGTMLQVCDGVTRWDFRKVLDAQQCSKLLVTPVFKILNRPDCDAEFREAVLANMGFAGPDALLTGLRKAFVFDQTREGTIDGKAVWILGGTWKEGKTPVLPGGASIMPGAPLPQYVPSLVYLSIGKDDGWPYQVVFEGRIPSQLEQRKKLEPVLGPDGRPVDQKLTKPSARPSKITLTYSEVQLNVTVPAEAFAFAPPAGVKANDETDQTVAQLEQLVTGLANKKKADAAKAGPVLDGALSAPVPGSPPGGAAKPPSEPPSAPK